MASKLTWSTGHPSVSPVFIFRDSSLLAQIFTMQNLLLSGQIECSDLREILTTLGDVLSPDEADELISDADMLGTGKVNYESLCRTLVYGPD